MAACERSTNTTGKGAAMIHSQQKRRSGRPRTRATPSAAAHSASTVPRLKGPHPNARLSRWSTLDLTNCAQAITGTYPGVRTSESGPSALPTT